MTRSHHRRRNVAKKRNENNGEGSAHFKQSPETPPRSPADSGSKPSTAAADHGEGHSNSKDSRTNAVPATDKGERGQSHRSDLRLPPTSGGGHGTALYTDDSKHTSEMIVPDLPSSPAPSDGENTRHVVHVHLPPFVHEEAPHDQVEETPSVTAQSLEGKAATDGEQAGQGPGSSTATTSGAVSTSLQPESPFVSPASSPDLTESDTKFSTQSADAMHQSRLRTMFLLDQDALSDSSSPDRDNEDDYQSVSLPDPAGRSQKRTYAFGHSTVISKSAPLSPGDEVRIRQGGKHTYYHHGIYIGNEKVVHVNGDFQSGFRWLFKPKYSVASVRCNSVSDFVGGDDRIKDIEVVHREFDASDNILHKTPAEVVECAKACVDQPFNWNPLFHNCEHFATWCKYGPNGVQSTQITERDNWKKGIYSTWLWITVLAGLLKLVLLYIVTMVRNFSQWRRRKSSQDFNFTLIRAIADMTPQLQFRPMEITNHYYPKGYHVNPHSPVYRAQVAKAAKDVTGDVEKVITQIDDTANVIRKLTGSRLSSPQPPKPPQCSSAPLPSVSSPTPDPPSASGPLTGDHHHLRLPPAAASLRSASAGIATV